MLAILIFLILFWINRLALHLHTRSYVWEKGCYPFVKRRDGSLDEFTHLNLVLEPIVHNGEKGQTSITYLWCLRFVSSTKPCMVKEQPAILFTDYGRISEWGCPDREVMLPLAQRLADRTGIPLAISGILTKREQAAGDMSGK